MLYCSRNPTIKKPQTSDSVDITDLNDNSDYIDGVIAKSNFNGAVDPAVSDDITDGYAIGSWWINTTAHRVFVAEDVATGSAVWRLIWPEDSMVVYSRHLPILAATGAAEELTTAWSEAIFLVPPLSTYTVIDAGVIPDKLSTAFGAATHNFSLTLKNKGTDGTGTTSVSATKQFSSAATVGDAVSFGAIAAPSVTAGQVLAVEKTITGNGLVCQGCTLYVILNKTS